MNVVSYIDNHYAFHIPQERLCRISFMGSTKLKKAFKSFIGCTISEYILQKRIGQAQHLLIGTDLSIAEIAKEQKLSDTKEPTALQSNFKNLRAYCPGSIEV